MLFQFILRNGSQTVAFKGRLDQNFGLDTLRQ